MTDRITISNSDDIIDSRDVIARIEELSDARDAYVQCEGDPETWEEAWPEDAEELAALQSLAEEGACASDWTHGETLIRDSYFEKYAQELAEDIGAIGRDLPWPACHIDWAAAAEALTQDYTSVEFDGVTYWVRS